MNYLSRSNLDIFLEQLVKCEDVFGAEQTPWGIAQKYLMNCKLNTKFLGLCDRHPIDALLNFDSIINYKL